MWPISRPAIGAIAVIALAGCAEGPGQPFHLDGIAARFFDQDQGGAIQPPGNHLLIDGYVQGIFAGSGAFADLGAVQERAYGIAFRSFQTRDRP